MTAQTRQPGADAQKHDVDIHGLLSHTEKVANALAQLAKHARKSGNVDIDPLTALDVLKQLREQLDSLSHFRIRIDELERENGERAERQLLELESDLRDACSQRGWRIHGQWPTLYIERGIAVEIDTRKRVASIAGKKLASVSVSDIVSSLEPMVRELYPKTFSARAFIDELARAYHEVPSTSGQVALFDVYRVFVMRSQNPSFWRNARSDSFIGISADQFRARLSRALEEKGTSASDGRELRLLPPLRPEDGLFLYQPNEDRFGYVGRLEFVSPNPMENV